MQFTIPAKEMHGDTWSATVTSWDQRRH